MNNPNKSLVHSAWIIAAAIAMTLWHARAVLAADKAVVDSAPMPLGHLVFAVREALHDARHTVRVAADEAAVAGLWQRDAVSIDLPVGGTTDGAAHLLLDLYRVNVIAPDAKFIVMQGGKPVEVSPPGVRTYRGTVSGESDSHVFLALTSRGAGSGSITRGDGSIITIGSDVDPADNRPRGLIIQQGPGDVPEFPEFCHVISNGAPGGNGDSGGIAGSDLARGPRILRVAIDSDFAYRKLFTTDADALAYMAQVIGAVDDIYRRDLNFTLQLAFTRIWPAGGEPFAADDLGGFRDYWVANENTAGLNLVHLFSGRRDLSYGGVAYIADACDGFGFGISGFLLASVPANPGLPPDLGNWDVVVVAHEMGHNMGTYHTHDYTPPVDTCASGTDERGTIMSYCHTRPGGLLNIDVRMHRVTQNVIADANAAVTCLVHDCNGNGIDDAADITSGFSVDVNLDGVPDECQDCDSNGILDPQEIAAGAPDIDGDGIPDACESDCNGNGLPDLWECNFTKTSDENGNNVPDECEPDCNDNGVADHIDIHAGTLVDLDRNSVPDICQDCNDNGLSDWIDVGRQYNLFISQAGGVIREYHRASGVAVTTVAPLQLQSAHDEAFGADRQLYVADYTANRIMRVNPDTNTAAQFIAAGTGGLAHPSGLAFGPNGNLFVVSQGTSRVLEFNGTTGALVKQFQTTGGTVNNVLVKIAFGPDGNVYVTSANNSVLKFITATGLIGSTYISGAPGGLSDPRGLAFLPDGSLLVANFAGNRITRHAAGTGELIGQFNDEYPLTTPWAVTVGPNGNVYASAAQNPVRVIEYSVNGGHYLRSFVRGDGVLNTPPTAVVFRPASPADANGNNIPDVCENLCPADVSPSGGNGVVNIDDLLAVINAWGPCANPNACPADIAPPGPPMGNDVVNIDDLLAVINAWGPCQ